MLSNDIIAGTLKQYDEPDWEPLRALVGMDLADWFMWMHEVELADGTSVHAYKHIATRRYFHLAHDGRAFAYLPRGGYTELHPRRAIDLVFEDWDQLGSAPDDPEAVRAALRRARRAATQRASRRATHEALERERRDSDPRSGS
jgi:hypothetical protein